MEPCIGVDSIINEEVSVVVESSDTPDITAVERDIVVVNKE